VLKIKKSLPKAPPKEVQFESPSVVQNLAIEMLIILNRDPLRQLVIGPDVGLNLRILVNKAQPHFFFNPAVMEPNPLQSIMDDSIIRVRYNTYLGDTMEIVLDDADHVIRDAIEYLHNGKPAKKPKKKEK
jgi:hypothetical protein